MRDIINYTDEYIKLPFEKYQVYYRRKKVLEGIKMYKHDNVLEIGCGMEPIFEYLDDFNRIVIIEPSKRFYENIHNKASKLINDKKLICINGFLENEINELSKYNYDYIILSGLMHEVEKPEILIKSLKSLCNKNTTIHINVPNALSFHRLLAKEMNIIENVYEKSDTQKRMQQHSTFSITTLKEFVIENGFDVLEEGSYFLKPFTHEQMQKCLDNDIFDENLLNGLYNIISIMPEYGSEIYVNIKLRD